MPVPPTPGMESVVCNLCWETTTKLFRHCRGQVLVQCAGCGLVYVNPRPTSEHLADHYNAGLSSRAEYYRDVECADRRTFDELLAVLASVVPEQGTLLDVGCNIGTCLAQARERGWQVQGVEVNAAAAQYCREQHGLPIVAGTLERDTFAARSFDAVLMGDVIEHLPDPVGMMRTIRRILKPGGIVLISTPDIAGWAARLLQVKPDEHIYYFTPATMTRLLERAGLEVAHIRPLDRYHNLTAMTHSTTFGGLFQNLRVVFNLAHRVLGDLVIRLPLKENLLAVARKPAVDRHTAPTSRMDRRRNGSAPAVLSRIEKL